MTRTKDDDQIAKPVARPSHSDGAKRRGQASPSAWNQPIPAWLVRLGLGVLLVCGIVFATSHDKLWVYERYWRGPVRTLDLPFASLAPELDEAQVARLLGPHLSRCAPEEQATAMGTRVCYAQLTRLNGLPTVSVALFLKNNRLSAAILHVPWWAHKTWHAHLETQHGPGRDVPRSTSGDTDALRAWRVANGFLSMNRDRSINPLHWSTILWMPGKP